MKIVLMILLAIASLILITSVSCSPETAPVCQVPSQAVREAFGKKKSKGYEALLEK